MARISVKERTERVEDKTFENLIARAFVARNPSGVYLYCLTYGHLLEERERQSA